jgi:hypothetical protein
VSVEVFKGVLLLQRMRVRPVCVTRGHAAFDATSVQRHSSILYRNCAYYVQYYRCAYYVQVRVQTVLFALTDAIATTILLLYAY